MQRVVKIDPDPDWGSAFRKEGVFPPGSTLTAFFIAFSRLAVPLASVASLHGLSGRKHRLEFTLPQAVQTVSVVLDKTGLLKVKTRDPSMKRCPRVHQVCSGQKSQQAGWA